MNLLQIYQWVCQWKNFENRLTFGKVMGKSLVSCFFWDTVYILSLVECIWTLYSQESLCFGHLQFALSRRWGFALAFSGIWRIKLPGIKWQAVRNPGPDSGTWAYWLPLIDRGHGTGTEAQIWCPATKTRYSYSVCTSSLMAVWLLCSLQLPPFAINSCNQPIRAVPFGLRFIWD